VLPDPQGIAMRALQVNGIPFVLALDAAGRVTRKGAPGSYRDLLALLGERDDEALVPLAPPALVRAPGARV
jgi:hypothetical protein